MDEKNMLESAIAYHGPMLCQILAEQNIETRTEEERHKLKLIKFIVNKRKWFFKPLTNSVQIPTPASSIETFPIEMFGNFDKQARRRHFFANFNLGDVLIGKIINVTLRGYYKMLVLCKHGEDRKLDDLSLVVYFPKKNLEDSDKKALPKEEINAGDLFRVVVITCMVESRKIIVNDDIIPGITIPKGVKLGKVSKSELPCYVGVNSNSQSLVDRLHRTKSFYDPSWAEELTIGFDIDRHRIYSLHEDLDGLDFPKESCAAELRKQQDHLLSEKLHKKGTAYYKEGKLFEAFECFTKAIERNKKNVEAYVSRGIAYANSNKMPLAIDDLEKAIAIDINHAHARTTLSELLVIMAKSHADQNDKEAAKASLDLSLTYNQQNEEARAALSALHELKSKETEVALSALNLKEDSPIDEEAPISELEKKKLQIKERLSTVDDKGNSSDEEKRKLDRFLRAARLDDDKATSSHKKRDRVPLSYRRHHRHHRHHHHRSKNRSLSGRRRSSSSDRKRSSSGERRTPSDRKRSPSSRRWSPSDRRRSPSSRRWSPSDRRGSPSSRRWSPSDRRRSSSERGWSPSDRKRSSSERGWSPSDRRSPSNRKRSPPTRRWSPDRRRSPVRRYSPVRRRTPERRRKRLSSDSFSSRSPSKTPPRRH